MNTENHITPDELFNSALSNWEVPFEETSWIDMRNKLDAESTRRPYFLLPFIDSKQKLNNYLAMITTSILAIISIIATTNSNSDIKTAHSNDIKNVKPYISSTPKISTNSEKESKEDKTPLPENNNGKTITTEKTKSNISLQNPITTGEVNTPQQPSNPLISAAGVKNYKDQGNKVAAVKQNPNYTNYSLNGANLFRVNRSAALTKPDWANNGQRFNLLKTPSTLKEDGGNLNTMRYGSLGIYFTGQAPYEDTASFLRRSFGFNLEIQSRNLLQSNRWAAYMGIDWGMQWYGHGANSIVAINTTNVDSGFTRLNMSSMDFLINGKLELGGKLPIHPYINGFVGPRLYFWQQYTESFRHLRDYENSSSNNAHTSATINYGIGLGARARLSRYVHLDARATIMKNSNLKMVDMDKSSFNGLKYDLVTKFHEPTYYQLRLGVIFEFGEEDHYEEEDETYYNNSSSNDVNQQYLYYYLDSTGKAIKCIPCPCDSAKSKDTTSYNYDEMKGSKLVKVYRVPVNTTRNGTVIYPGTAGGFGNSRGSSSTSRRGSSGVGPTINSGSSSSKGSFPGIKSGGSSSGSGGTIIKPRS